jgi:hypothetical protein
MRLEMKFLIEKGSGCCGKYFEPKKRKQQEAEENCVMRSFIIFTLTKCSGDQIKEEEMGGVCNTHGEMRNA